MTEPKFIYLDFNASTPVAPEAVAAMLPWLSDRPWNPASAHAGGRLANAAVEAARAQVAALIGASTQEIVWTSGSTEANNLAIRGSIAGSAPGARVLVASTEHTAVLDTAYALQADGFKVEELPVDASGLLDVRAFESAMGDDVALVSVMLANNETGVLQDLRGLANVAHEAGAVVHTDATQAAGRVPVDVHELAVDLVSLSGHKLYGPMGVGALYVRRGLRLAPQQLGGGQEKGFRSGTINVAGAVGMGAAAAVALGSLIEDGETAAQLVELLVSEVRRSWPTVGIVAESAPRLPNTVNLHFHGIDAEAVMVNAPTVLMSSGSACTSRIPEASHVLQAMGMSQDAAYECLRLSVGRTTSRDDVVRAARLIVAAAQRVHTINEGEIHG